MDEIVEVDIFRSALGDDELVSLGHSDKDTHPYLSTFLSRECTYPYKYPDNFLLSLTPSRK